MNTRRAKIRRAKIRRVDIVDSGANQDAHILLAKNRGEDPNSVEAIRKRVKEYLDSRPNVNTVNIWVSASKTEIEDAVEEVAPG